MTFASSSVQDRERVDRIVVWLDQFEAELERLRKPEEAMKVRQIAHDLAVFRLEFFGPVEGERK